MNAYELPTSLNIGGVDYAIRTDFRAILDILIAQNDPELDQQCKTIVMIKIFYPEWYNIPAEYLEDAVHKTCEFIDCGQRDNGRKNPKLVDWEQDARLIIPAVNKVAHTEIRAVPYMHWWTFFSYYMEIGESLFSSVVSYRSNRAKHKKKESWEKEFYKDNKDLIDFKEQLSEEEQAAKDNLLQWL